MSAPERAKGEYWIILLAGVLLLGLGVGVAVAKFASPFPFAASPTPTASAAPSRSATPSPASDDVSAWTPYVDAADKFSLRYPAAAHLQSRRPHHPVPRADRRRPRRLQF
jgi:hypothetical protein